MRSLSKKEKELLQEVYNSGAYEVMEIISKEMIEEWHSQQNLNGTNDEVLRNFIHNDGKISGLKIFLEMILKQIESLR